MKIISSRLPRKLTSSAIVAVAGVAFPAMAEMAICQSLCTSKAQSGALTAAQAAQYNYIKQCGGGGLCWQTAGNLYGEAYSIAYGKIMSDCMNQCYGSQ